MSHYLANVRDLRFNLFELFRRQDLLGRVPYADFDQETAETMLAEVQRLATGVLAGAFADSAHGDVHFDRESHSVSLPQTFRDAYAEYISGQWWRLDITADLGGTPAPPSLRWALAELVLGANPAAFIYAAGWMHANILHALGNEEQRRIAQLMTDRAWGATMVLTEPDAGSSVGAGRTRAVPQPDGSWHIEGVKRFITSADHDLSENIIHFVLARPVDTPGAGGPGTKGLSLFLVPKFRFDPQTGVLGERNGVHVTNVEHKMGLRVSATCELTFGQHQPAVGLLVGDVHSGIAQMFKVVEYARMLVGTKAMATLSTGYLNALAYAKDRVQGPSLARRGDRLAPDVAIIDHPDVRRSLLTQKAYAEGLRSLVLLGAACQDEMAIGAAPGGSGAEDRSSALAATARNDLLLPIIKGFSSERAYAVLADSLQIFGGSGYLQDYPIEQYLRDAKIDTVYEGTTGIQGIDLFFRKIVRDDCRAVHALLDEIDAYAAGPVSCAIRLRPAVATVRATVALMFGWAQEAKDVENIATGAGAKGINRVGLNTTRLLMMFGELLVGWLLSRGADVAAAALAENDCSASDTEFYQGKIAAAQFFAETRLPLLEAERWIVEGTQVDVMEVSAGAF